MGMVSTAETIDLPRSDRIDTSPPRLSSPEVASEPPPSPPDAFIGPIAGDTPDRSDPSGSSPKPNLDDETQVASRSEEYRQLFRLPPNEVLVQDFNCAYQESILLQGHMYLFIRHICFYSNIFGFETKKIIQFHEVTSVKRAKTAGIFPNAIEIFAGGKKYFFASFLSRDEAFKLIHDGWLEQGNGDRAVPERQESISELSSQENEVVIEKTSSSSKNLTDELDASIRNGDAPVLNDSELPDSCNQNDASTSNNVEQDAEPAVNTECSSSTKGCTWKLEDLDPSKISEDYAKVAGTKFLIKIEEFFRLFFSDCAVGFIESFHKKCGDKEFSCTSWQPHDKYGHSRNVTFLHPIKIYFVLYIWIAEGAKFGSCREMQKFRVYRNSHLVIETSQEINDVPYGDYFTVEGLWDVQRESIGSKEGCILQVYINVAFSKRTVWKGKIVQSTVEECREAYATWIEMAHDLLKQRNLEKQTGTSLADSLIQNNGVSSEGGRQTKGVSEMSQELVEPMQVSRMFDHRDLNPQAVNLFQGSLRNATYVSSFIRDAPVKLCSFLRSQSRISQVLVIAFVVILLMQVTILVLLNRPQHIHLAYPMEHIGSGLGRMGDRSAENIAWMEKRIRYLKDEMLMVESRLERMWHEHAVLKVRLKDLEQFQKQR